MEIRNHKLQGPNIKYMESTTHSGEFKAGNLDTLILHYTASPTMESAVASMMNPTVKASAHVAVGRDGSIVQLVPFNIIAWHAGQSSYNGRTGYNNYSIGIEMVNVGYVTKSGETFRSVYGKVMDQREVIQAVHRNEKVARYWQTYTVEQIETVRRLCELLIDTYNIKSVLGHEEIAPQRKFDPGPAFPLDKFRERLLFNNKDVDDDYKPESGTVIVKKLNIRANPSTTGDTIAKPLNEGARIDIIEERNGWYKINVKTEIEGWVDGRFLVND